MISKALLPKKLPNRKIISIDIGGTLAKTAFYIPQDQQKKLEADGRLQILTQNSIPKLENGEKIYLKSFKSGQLNEFIDFVKENELLPEVGENGQTILHATGGGAYKYQTLFEEEFQGKVKLQKHDEMASLVNGMSFLLKSAKNPSYTFREGEGKKMIESEHNVNKSEDNSAQSITEDDSSINSFMQGPKSKMLVSIGSGVSMIKINPSSGAFERVSGTMIGGGTLMGLSNLLTSVSNFDDIISHCEKGDNSNVDMLVKDIYGDQMPFKELQGDWLASSFAKVANDHTTPGDEIMNVYKKEDIIKSLMFMISFNIGQLAYLTSVIHDIDDIYFVGNYIRDNNIGKEKITFAVDLMSQSQKRPLFMTYDGYMGAIGAFLEEFKEQ